MFDRIAGFCVISKKKEGKSGRERDYYKENPWRNYGFRFQDATVRPRNLCLGIPAFDFYPGLGSAVVSSYCSGPGGLRDWSRDSGDGPPDDSVVERET